MSPRYAELEAETARHLDGLHAFALQLAGNAGDAERLVIDTMLRARERWEHFRLGTDVRVWLFTLLHGLFAGRRQRSEAMPSIGELDDGAAGESIGEVDPEGEVYRSLTDDEIFVALDALPEPYRVPVLLADLHAFDYAAIAEVLGLPERTVEMRLFRGRGLLQRQLVGYAVAMGHLRLPDAPAG